MKKIVVTDIRKSFSDSKCATLPVVGGISFTVADDEFVAIVGPSGCDKSTLMNIVKGFERPDSGTVEVDGCEQLGPSPKGSVSSVSSQHSTVFPWLTVHQNRMFGLNGDEHGDKAALADHCAAMVGLKGFESAYCPSRCRAR